MSLRSLIFKLFGFSGLYHTSIIQFATNTREAVVNVYDKRSYLILDLVRKIMPLHRVTVTRAEGES